LIADAVGDVTGGDNLTGQLAMTGLIIEKYVGGESFKKRGFRQTAKEQGFIQTNVPLAQCADHPLMSRCRARGHQRRANRAGIVGKLSLQQIECRQEAFERPPAQWLTSRLTLAGLKRFQATRLIYALGLIGKQHRVAVEGDTQLSTGRSTRAP